MKNKSARWLKLTLGIVPSLLSFAQAHANEQAGLNFQPYSSSYLPKLTGNLTKRGATPLDPKLMQLLNPQITGSFGLTSTAERFDAARSQVLGIGNPLAGRLEFSHHSQDTENTPEKLRTQPWEGFCNQWSAASLNPEISNFVNSSAGIVCKGALITQGELKELFTGLYDFADLSTLYGARTFNTYQDKNRDRMRDTIGIDDLQAHVFNDQLFSNLKQNRGVVIDLDSGPEVWNQPVFKAQSEDKNLRFPQDFNGEALKKIPAYAYQTSDPGTADLVTRIAGLDLAMMKYNLTDCYDRTQKEVDKQCESVASETLKSAAEKLGVKGHKTGWFRSGNRQMSVTDVINTRNDMIKNELTRAIHDGKVSLKPGVTIQHRDTTITFGVETKYAVSTNNSTTRKYSYYLISQNGQVVDSTWDTARKDRPDFLWVPETANPALAKNEYQRASFDLINLMKTCTPITKIVQFFRTINEAMSDNRVDAEERNCILSGYYALKDYINKGMIADILQKSGAVGLSLSDFS